MPPAYPILLDVTDRKIVIIGGGAVGLRKALGLVEAGARDVTVVSPVFASGFPPSARLVKETYRPEHLEGAAIVFAATDSVEVNAQVVHDARRRNALACRADTDDSGDFTTPAVMRQGPITVAVSAGAPAFSAAVRDGLRRRWDSKWTEMAQAIQILRPSILAAGLPPQRRRELLRDLAGDLGMKTLAAGGIEGLRQWVQERIRNAQ
jgi:precorrin-2 dehydrogenase / sirohydrochlorin ferrochelatase